MTTFTHVAFLRAMNVGGRRVTNDALCGIVRAAGFADVAAYQASGNLLLSGDGPVDLDQLGSILEASLGYHVSVMIRPASRLRHIAQTTAFNNEQLSQTSSKVQVIVLHHELSAAERRIVEEANSAEDQLVLDGGEIHWLPRAGISDSDLDVHALNDRIGPLTVRTHGTISRIANKL